MREYDIKRGHFKNIDGKLEEIMRECFGSVKNNGEFLESSYGALVYIRIKPKGKTALIVDSETDKTADLEIASKTIRAYNDFLFKVTGMTGKQRGKREQEKLKKEAKKAAEGE